MTHGLVSLKLLGRNTQGAEALFSEKGILQLMKITGLDDDADDLFQDTPSTHEGLKCVANCILLDENTKLRLENNQGVAACGKILQSNANLSMETQFLICRILFFLTANRRDIVLQLMDYDIVTSTTKLLTENVNRIIDNGNTINMTTPINPVSVVNEALKMLFNVILAYQHQPSTALDAFRECLLPILQIILLIPPPRPLPLSPPHSHAIHALMQYPCSIIVQMWNENKHALFPAVEDDKECRLLVVKKMTELLHDSLLYLIPDGESSTPPDRQHYNLDAILSPMVLVIRNLAYGDIRLRSLMADALLPQQSDRMTPVHQGKRLSAYLIRLMTSAMLPQTRNAVCETLFVVCDQDANQFTNKVGYGNAIGFLVNKGIAMEPPGEQGHDNDPSIINPITGQYVSAERDQGPALADMTDEEKEREAEKLFVLFERLKRIGIIDVENPIAKAMRQGDGDSGGGGDHTTI
ncbi:unnamed protein product [Absidia cylindrospora]